MISCYRDFAKLKLILTTFYLSYMFFYYFTNDCFNNLTYFIGLVELEQMFLVNN